MRLDIYLLEKTNYYENYFFQSFDMTCSNILVGCLQVEVERFLTPEQRRKVEEDKRTMEEKRLKEKGDNWRERGLDNMMGGVLEIKKEDELKKVPNCVA